MRAALALLSLLFCAQAEAATPAEVHGTLEFAPGYRRDNLQWSTGAPGYADTISELTWQRLLIYEFDARATVQYGRGLYGKLALGVGYITDGQVQDSDYGGDGRSLEWSRSNDRANFGHTFDFNMGVGYRMTFGRRSQNAWIPMLGLSYDSQRLSIRRGMQTLSACAPSPPFKAGTCGAPLGRINGLDSSYNALWVGPWIGTDFEHLEDQLLIGAGIEYHFRTKYSGTANWNLRDDLAHPVSFNDSASGQGTVVRLSLQWLQAGWSVGVMGERKQFAAGLGSQTHHFADGSAGSQPFNKVRWYSLSGTVALTVRH